MPIVVKKEKRKINYFFYASLIAFLLIVIWLVYSKWVSQKKRVSIEERNATSFDVTGGLADIKLEEIRNIADKQAYKDLSRYSEFVPPENIGKSNPFAKDW